TLSLACRVPAFGHAIFRGVCRDGWLQWIVSSRSMVSGWPADKHAGDAWLEKAASKFDLFRCSRCVFGFGFVVAQKNVSFFPTPDKAHGTSCRRRAEICLQPPGWPIQLP